MTYSDLHFRKQGFAKGFLLLLAAMVFLGFALGGCATVTPSLPPAVADCTLADDLQKLETVKPLPEDHDLSVAETWQQLKDHMEHEKQVADRSNDKTAFVNAHCRSTPLVNPAQPPAPAASKPWWKVL